MTKGQRIKKLRETRGLSQVELADAINVSKQTLYKYENDIITNIPSDKIEAIASILHSEPGYIMGWKQPDSGPIPQYSNISPVVKRSIPVLGKIACGEPILMDEQVELYVDAVGKFQCDYILWAKGDSMIGAGIHNGDAVFIRKQPTVENGEIAAVAIGDEATLKRFYFYPEKSMMILRAENPAFQDIIKTDDELADVIVLGRAMSVQTLLK